MVLASSTLGEVIVEFSQNHVRKNIGCFYINRGKTIQIVELL
jgi:hypothetical protein